MKAGILTPSQAALLERPLVAILGTTSPSGAPHLAAVWFTYRNGVFLIATGAASRKAKNVRAHRLAELCVNEGAVGPCVTARGIATVTGHADVGFVDELARRYLGDAGGARFMANRDAQSESVLVELRPESWRVWDIGPSGS